MKLQDIMRRGRDVVSCTSSEFVTDAARKMKEHNVGCILITEKGSLKGILTDRDIALNVIAEGKDPREIHLGAIMKTNVITGRPDWDLFEATQVMSEKKIRRLPITSNGRVEGFISLADLAPVLKKELDAVLGLEATPVAQ